MICNHGVGRECVRCYPKYNPEIEAKIESFLKKSDEFNKALKKDFYSHNDTSLDNSSKSGVCKSKECEKSRDYISVVRLGEVRSSKKRTPIHPSPNFYNHGVGVCQHDVSHPKRSVISTKKRQEVLEHQRHTLKNVAKEPRTFFEVFEFKCNSYKGFTDLKGVRFY